MSEIVELPLKDISRPKQWPTLSRRELKSEGYPVYGANGRIGFAATYTHDEPTIIIGCRGSCGTLHITEPKSYVTGNAMALDNLDTKRVDQSYLFHFLSKRGFKDVVSGSSQPQITGKGLTRVTVPLPPLDEQRRIAAMLDKADAIRRKREQFLIHLDSLGQALFHDLFGVPLSPSQKHPIRPLKDFVASDRPITYGILKPGPDTDGGVPYIRVVDMVGGEIGLANIKKTTAEIAHQYRRSELKPGDLLMSIRGHVGRTSIVPTELAGANITQDTARLAVPEAEAEYFRHIIMHPVVQHWMAQRTKGAAVKGINLSDLRELPVLDVPSEQRLEFSNKIHVINSLRSLAKSDLSGSDKLFASLSQRAFRGEL